MHASAWSRSPRACSSRSRPRWGAYVVAAWLAGIIFNLLTYSGFYDVACATSA